MSDSQVNAKKKLFYIYLVNGVPHTHATTRACLFLNLILCYLRNFNMRMTFLISLRSRLAKAIRPPSLSFSLSLSPTIQLNFLINLLHFLYLYMPKKVLRYRKREKK